MPRRGGREEFGPSRRATRAFVGVGVALVLGLVLVTSEPFGGWGQAFLWTGLTASAFVLFNKRVRSHLLRSMDTGVSTHVAQREARRRARAGGAVVQTPARPVAPSVVGPPEGGTWTAEDDEAFRAGAWRSAPSPAAPAPSPAAPAPGPATRRAPRVLIDWPATTEAFVSALAALLPRDCAVRADLQEVVVWNSVATARSALPPVPRIDDDSGWEEPLVARALTVLEAALRFVADHGMTPWPPVTAGTVAGASILDSGLVGWYEAGGASYLVVGPVAIVTLGRNPSAPLR